MEFEEMPERDLITAVKDGDYHKMKRLLNRGINVNIRDRMRHNEGLLTLAIPHPKYSYHMTKDLIHQGIDVNIPTKDGTTPLMMVILQTDLPLFKLLIVLDSIEINCQDNQGDTALHMAATAKLNSKEFIEVLLAKGADVTIKNKKGETALHSAMYSLGAATYALEILVKSRGVELEARDNLQRTPLHLAAMKGNQYHIRVLLSKGAKVNAKDHENCTPLHLAAKKGHLKAVETLLQAEDIQINSRDSTLCTALHYATKEGHRQIARILLSRGAARGMKDNKGWIPEDYCKTLKGSSCEKVYKGDHRPLLQAVSDVISGERFNPNKIDIKTGREVGKKNTGCLLM